MGLEYSAVQWNRQKRIYDLVLAGGVGAFLILFGVLSKVHFPFVTDEIMLMAPMDCSHCTSRSACGKPR